MGAVLRHVDRRRLEGVGSKCMPPDGASSWGQGWGEAARDEQLARAAAPNAALAAFWAAQNEVGTAEDAPAAANTGRLEEPAAPGIAHEEVVRLADIRVVVARAALERAAAVAPQAALHLRRHATGPHAANDDTRSPTRSKKRLSKCITRSRKQPWVIRK